jgi:NAD-dependent deacetylase
MEQQIVELRRLIEQSSRIVFFGGAGVSTESGVPDFRSADGLYAQKWKYPPETIVSHTFFVNNTEEFYHFYREKFIFPDVTPNAAHIALASLERRGKLSAIVTQNIDGLHQAAGNKVVYELHGSVHRNFCVDCRRSFSLEAITQSVGVPRCSCGGLIKPDVVLYEEALDNGVVEGAVAAISKADMLIVGGTSLAVYPAAGLLRYFRGTRLVVINRDPTSADANAALVINGKIGEVLAAAVLSE